MAKYGAETEGSFASIAKSDGFIRRNPEFAVFAPDGRRLTTAFLANHSGLDSIREVALGQFPEIHTNESDSERTQCYKPTSEEIEERVQNTIRRLEELGLRTPGTPLDETGVAHLRETTAQVMELLGNLPIRPRRKFRL